MSSSNNQKFDLTQGPILNKLLMVAVPIMGTQFMQMTYNLTDMFWLGRIGSDAVAASGSAGMFLWLSQAFMMVGRMGSEIGVSQSLGQGSEKRAKNFLQNSMFLAVVLGLLFAFVMILFRNPLIGFFNIPQKNVADDAAAYLAIVGLGIPFTFITGAISGAFTGSGNSKTPFYINSIGLITNMILDPLLILQLNMGIVGAAFATITAQILVCILFLFAIKKGGKRPFEQFSFFIKPAKDVIQQIFRWSIPISSESLLFTVLSMIISRIIAQWGADAIAVQKVGSQIESLAWLIGGGFSSAVTAFIGQNFGAGKWSRIRDTIKISMVTMFTWGLISFAVMFFGGTFLFKIFLDEPELLFMGSKFLKILAFSQVIGCLEYNSAGIFRGIGNTMPPSIASIGGNALRVPLVYFLSRTSLGLDGIWIGISLGGAIRSLWVFLWFLVVAKKLPKDDRKIQTADI